MDSNYSPNETPHNRRFIKPRHSQCKSRILNRRKAVTAVTNDNERRALNDSSPVLTPHLQRRHSHDSMPFNAKQRSTVQSPPDSNNWKASSVSLSLQQPVSKQLSRFTPSQITPASVNQNSQNAEQLVQLQRDFHLCDQLDRAQESLRVAKLDLFHLQQDNQLLKQQLASLQQSPQTKPAHNDMLTPASVDAQTQATTTAPATASCTTQTERVSAKELDDTGSSVQFLLRAECAAREDECLHLHHKLTELKHDLQQKQCAFEALARAEAAAQSARESDEQRWMAHKQRLNARIKQAEAQRYGAVANVNFHWCCMFML